MPLLCPDIGKFIDLSSYSDACDLLVRVYEHNFTFNAALAVQKYAHICAYLLHHDKGIRFGEFVLLLRALYPDEDNVISAGVVACASLYEADAPTRYGLIIDLNSIRIHVAV